MVDQIFELFRASGQSLYFGESISEQEHALQAAHLAEISGADDELVCAALLHDVGHLLHGLGEDIASRGVDARHEDGGAQWLKKHFRDEVTEPVRLHVAAKRYLCAAEPGYREALSPASEQSLRLQGGPMDADEVREFERHRLFKSIVALRRWDDGAKVPDWKVPGLEHYRPRLQKALDLGRESALS